MSTLSEIRDAAQAIRRFLEQQITPQLINSLQAALDTIRNTLGDPNLQANLRATLEQLRILLENANREDLVGQMADLMRQANEILKNVDPETVRQILGDLSQLLSAAEKANMVEKITEALKSVASLHDLADLAKELSLPAKYLMYGVTGTVIGVAIIGAIQVYLTSRRDERLQASIDRLVSINAQILNLQIQELRVLYGTYALKFDVIRHRNPHLQLDEQAFRLRDEARRILNALAPMSENDIELIQKAQEFSGRILSQTYQAELDNESMTDYFGRIGNNDVSWAKLIEYVTYFPQYQLFGQKKDKPILPRDELNYSQVRRLYGERNVDAMMSGLAKEFEANGGNDLYYGLVNSFENAIHEFSECLQQISQIGGIVTPETPWSPGATQLRDYYHKNPNDPAHNNAHTYIQSQWNEIDWALLDVIQVPELTDRVSNIIRMRAFMEFCHQTAPYLCAPYNMSREIGNGIADVPIGLFQTTKGLFQAVIHPIDTVHNLGNLAPVEGMRNVVSRAYNHPTRVLSSMVVSGVVGVGGAKLLAPPPVATFGVAAPVASSTIPAAVGGTALAADAIVTQVGGDISTKHESNNSASAGQEMVEDRELPSVRIEEWYAQLIDALRDVDATDDITCFDRVIVEWYEKATLSAPSKILEVSEEKSSELTDEVKPSPKVYSDTFKRSNCILFQSKERLSLVSSRRTAFVVQSDEFLESQDVRKAEEQLRELTSVRSV